MSPRPKILDELGRELVRAARAAEANGARGAIRARTPRAFVIGLLALLGLAAAATAATLIIGRGDPIPPARSGDVPLELRPVAGSARLNGLNVADPDGGPLWDVRTSRSRTGAVCTTVGQVLDGELGLVGLDRRFRALPAGAADTCSTPQRRGATLAGARAFRGGDKLTALTVVNGVAAPAVRRATAVAGGRTVRMRLGPGHAFLAVFRGLPEQVRPRVVLTEADGRRTTLRFADRGEFIARRPVRRSAVGAEVLGRRTRTALRRGAAPARRGFSAAERAGGPQPPALVGATALRAQDPGVRRDPSLRATQPAHRTRVLVGSEPVSHRHLGSRPVRDPCRRPDRRRRAAADHRRRAPWRLPRRSQRARGPTPAARQRRRPGARPDRGRRHEGPADRARARSRVALGRLRRDARGDSRAVPHQARERRDQPARRRSDRRSRVGVAQLGGADQPARARQRRRRRARPAVLRDRHRARRPARRAARGRRDPNCRHRPARRALQRTGLADQARCGQCGAHLCRRSGVTRSQAGPPRDLRAARVRRAFRRAARRRCPACARAGATRHVPARARTTARGRCVARPPGPIQRARRDLDRRRVRHRVQAASRAVDAGRRPRRRPIVGCRRRRRRRADARASHGRRRRLPLRRSRRRHSPRVRSSRATPGCATAPTASPERRAAGRERRGGVR